jgi:hypothetical protein
LKIDDHQFEKINDIARRCDSKAGLLDRRQKRLSSNVGHTSWTAKLLGFESTINDAAPGVVLFVGRVFFVWITKPRVKLGDLQGLIDDYQKDTRNFCIDR